MFDDKKFRREIYKSAQMPRAWLSSALLLKDAAESLIEIEQKYQIPYFRTYELAVQKAEAMVDNEGLEIGVADIEARVPNYPPAQLLYAYALENLIKGIIVSRTPLLINHEVLNKNLKSHDLIKLCKAADLQLSMAEVSVVGSLSKLSIWAGRYPVATNQSEHLATLQRNELLGYGSQHPVIRAFYRRCLATLEGLMPKEKRIVNEAVVVFRETDL